MMEKRPGIFNDVIGPIMRGPSSSHTAASWRAAKICMDILNEPLKKAIIDFDKDGAWASNYKGQGTPLGIEGGLLGLEMTDDRMKNTELVANELGISIHYEINSFKTNHVNTFRLLLEGINGKNIQVVAISIGGGSFEIQDIDGFEVKICGDFYEVYLFNSSKETALEELKSMFPQSNSIVESFNSDRRLINMKFSKEVSDETIEKLKHTVSFDELIITKPVLPIVAGNESELPFTSVASLLEFAEKENLDLGALGLIYEQRQSGLEDSAVIDRMKNLVSIIENSIKTGLAGTTYEDRILPQQSHLIDNAKKRNKILQNSIIIQIIANVSSIMESKSAM